MLLFKDSIRLFAAYNEGIINLLGKIFEKRLFSDLFFIFLFPLIFCSSQISANYFFSFHQTEKYFDMKKTQCKEGLDIYKKFLTRMTRISEFLKVAEVSFTTSSIFATHKPDVFCNNRFDFFCFFFL